MAASVADLKTGFGIGRYPWIGSVRLRLQMSIAKRKLQKALPTIPEKLGYVLIKRNRALLASALLVKPGDLAQVAHENRAVFIWQGL
jgi:hypothetical protein